MQRRLIALATLAALPWCASARDTGQPMETTVLPVAVPVATADATLPDDALAHNPPAAASAAPRASAPAATPPKPEAERRTRKAERLDRPPFIRPM